MKKQIKMISIALIITMILVSLSGVVFASDLSGTITSLKGGQVASDNITSMGSKIVATLQVIGVVVAVVVLLVLGIIYFR